MLTFECYAFGPFRLDVGAQQLTRDGRPVDLTPKAFRTLVVLVRHHDRVVTKEEIISAVWPDSYVSDDSLSQNIWTLRRVLGDHSTHPEYIATLPRRGYRVIAPVATVPPASVARDESPLRNAGDVEALPADVRVLPHRPQPRARLWIYGAALLTMAALVVGTTRGVTTSGAPAVEPPVQFTLTPPAGVTIADAGALSPDGRHLAFVGRDEHSDETRIWLRVLRSGEYRPLAGTDGANGLFWSPDSQSIAFFGVGRLRTVNLSSGSPQTIAKVGIHPHGGSWSADGTMLFTGYPSAVFAVRGNGQTVAPVTVLDTAHEISHTWPQFLPDGRHFLFYVASLDPQRAGTFLGSLDSPERRRLSPALNSPALYAPPGYLLYLRGHALVAQHFDTTTFRLTGEPTTVVADMPIGDFSSLPTLVSASGNALAFTGDAGARNLSWFSRSGQAIEDTALPLFLHSPQLMPNGRQLLGHSDDPERPGSWLVDFATGAANRLTPNGAAPVPSPDGTRFAFVWSNTPVASDIYVRPIAGGDKEELLLQTPGYKFIEGWSPDGRYIVYAATNMLRSDTDLWLLPTFGDRKPVPFLQTPYNELQSQISPDGRWLAYTSDKSGVWQVYVRAFPSAAGERAISAGGGAEARWSRDGSTLYYLAANHWLMAVDLTPSDPALFGKPRPLFHVPGVDPVIRSHNHYMVSSDGARFLVETAAAGAAAPINIVVNWRGLAQP